MKIRIWVGLGFSLMILAACNPQLERPGIPLIWGIRFDEAESANFIQENIDFLQEKDDLMIEFPLEFKAGGLPYLPELPLSTLRHALSPKKTSLNLALTNLETQTGSELQDSLVDTWFNTLFQLSDSLLASLHPITVKRMVIGNDLKQHEQFVDQWSEMFQKLKINHPKTLFSYGKKGKDIAEIKWWDKCDFIAVEYKSTANPNPKPFAMAYNPNLAQVADSLDMPIFIYRGNMIGKYKTIGLKNRLRFWPEGVRVDGLVCNSIYAKLPPLDSTTYFSVQKDQEFLDFWKMYKKR